MKFIPGGSVIEFISQKVLIKNQPQKQISSTYHLYYKKLVCLIYLINKDGNINMSNESLQK